MQNKRIQRLILSLEKDEAAIISSAPGRLYLTGLSSSAGHLLVTPQCAYFLIDSRYFEKAAATVTGCEVVLCDKLYEQINALLKKQGIGKIYLETGSVSMDAFAHYREKLDGITVSTDGKFQCLLTEMRSIKSPEEIVLIQRAQSLTDLAFTHILEHLHPGVSEREIMLEIEFFLRRQGSQGVSFDPIVVSGKNSSLPHGVPTEKLIEKGDFVTMDFGAVAGGYRSDMTRTVAVGQPDDEQIKVYHTVLRAQTAALEFIRPGVRCCDADKVARDIIEQAGYKDYFGHGLGHSVGIEIHETPSCSPRCETVMQAGTVMTVEPGIYLPGRFGVRIEDMVVLTKDGNMNLTESPKTMIIL